MRSLIETLPSAIVLIDDDNIVGWNSAAAALYGWGAHEAIDHSFRQLLVDDADRDLADEVFAQATARGRWNGNFRITRRDGAMLVSSFIATVVHDDGQRRIAWVATDVIDQHLAEQERDVLVSAQTAATQALESTLGLLEALLDCAPIGIAMLDRELCCTHANAMFASMLGTEQSPVGSFLDDLASLPADVPADLRRVVTTGRSIRDRRLVLRVDDGTLRHIAANYFPISSGLGEPAGAGITWTDTTAAEDAAGERANLARQATVAQQRLAVLASASAVMMSTSEIGQILERLTRILAPSAADWAIIELVGRTGLIEHVAAASADRSAAQRLCDALLGQTGALPGSVTERVLRTGRAQLVASEELAAAVANATNSPSHRLFGDLDLTSVVVVPIRSRGQANGVLIMANTVGSGPLLDDDLDVAVEVGHRAGLAIDRAITYQNEHMLAEQLQQALLPTHLPSIPGLRIVSRYSAAADMASVGGDWFDVLSASPEHVMLCIGDVIGHDTAAAVGMSRLRHIISAFARESAHARGGCPDPAEILDRVDRQVHDDATAWATCILAVLDTRTFELNWSTAGHLPMLLARDGQIQQLDGAGIMLGVVHDTRRDIVSTQLYPGDRLLMYTDGLVERRGEHLDTSISRLTARLRDLDQQPLDRTADEILRTMFVDTKQTDDAALLAIEIIADR